MACKDEDTSFIASRYKVAEQEVEMTDMMQTAATLRSWNYLNRKLECMYSIQVSSAEALTTLCIWASVSMRSTGME